VEMRAVRLVVRLARERSKNKWNMRKFVVNNIFLYFQERLKATYRGLERMILKKVKKVWMNIKVSTQVDINNDVGRFGW
jgi:hypothetical protein